MNHCFSHLIREILQEELGPQWSKEQELDPHPSNSLGWDLVREKKSIFKLYVGCPERKSVTKVIADALNKAASE